MSNLYLIGMMGAGKSSTGRALAGLLRLEFADLDEMICKKNHTTVAALFEKKGESYFRSEESCVLNEIADKDKMVVATGGGIILNPENILRMQKSGKLIYLKASHKMLWSRVKANTGRPLLKSQSPEKTLADLLEARKNLYQNAADMTVDTDGRSPADVAGEISQRMLKELKIPS